MPTLLIPPPLHHSSWRRITHRLCAPQAATGVLGLLGRLSRDRCRMHTTRGVTLSPTAVDSACPIGQLALGPRRQTTSTAPLPHDDLRSTGQAVLYERSTVHISWDQEKQESRHAAAVNDGGSLDKRCDGPSTQQSLLLWQLHASASSSTRWTMVQPQPTRAAGIQSLHPLGCCWSPVR